MVGDFTEKTTGVRYEMSRKEAKIATFLPLFGKIKQQGTPYCIALQDKFPILVAKMNEIKSGKVFKYGKNEKNNYKDLACFMQRLEAKIIIELVCTELIELGIVFIPIHDSIMTLARHVEKVKELIQKHFLAETGVNCCLKVEYLDGSDK